MTEWRLDSIGDDSPEPAEPARPGAASERQDAPPRRSSRRGADGGSGSRRRGARRHLGTVVALAVLAGFAGILWYAYDAYRTRGGGIAPLIRADVSPTRVRPEQPGGMDVPHRDRAVLQDTGGGQAGGDEAAEAGPARVDSAEAPLPRPGTRPEPPDGRTAAAGQASADPPVGSPASAPAPAVEVAAPDETPQAATGPAADTSAADTPAADTPAADTLAADTLAADTAPPDNAPPDQPSDDAEALIPRIEPASSSESASSPSRAEPGPGTTVAQDDRPAIADTPQLVADPPARQEGEDTASGSAPAAATDAPPTDAAPAPRVALPLGTVGAPAEAADLGIAGAQVPEDYDAAAALAGGTATQTPAPGDGSATAEAQTEDGAPAATEAPVDPAETEAGADAVSPDAGEAAIDAAATGEAAVPVPGDDAPAASPTADPAQPTPAASSAPPAPSFGPVPGGGWRIQLAATNSRESAEEEWRRFAARNPDVLGGLDLVVPQVTIDGTDWYRVQAGPLDRDRAEAICAELAGRGTDCLVRQQ